jgi:hypothetical protein
MVPMISGKVYLVGDGQGEALFVQTREFGKYFITVAAEAKASTTDGILAAIIEAEGRL